MSFDRLQWYSRFSFFWILAIVWSAVTVIKLLNAWIYRVGHYFYVLPHKKPADIKEQWTHGQIKLSVGF
jgi:hypothetical protein